MGCLSFLFPPPLDSAELVVIDGAQAGRRVEFSFLLRSYRLASENVYTEVALPGLPGAPLQFVRGKPRLLSMVMDFDGRAANRDVRELTRDVARLMAIDPDTHAPPRLRFEWRGQSLRCVLESAREEFVSSFADGRPARARLHVTLREMRTLAELQEELDRE